jgi:hypothetical protein
MSLISLTTSPMPTSQAVATKAFCYRVDQPLDLSTQLTELLFQSFRRPILASHKIFGFLSSNRVHAA